MIDYPAHLDAMWQKAVAPREVDAPTVVSTFAGGGGSLTGYLMAGYTDLLAVEWDDNAVATLRANYPDLDIYHGDIAALTVDEVLERTGLRPGDLDILDGSPPCQGFSTAGKRVMDDPRNQLFREYVRLLRGLRPKVFVMENVSGMVKGKMKLIFVEILKELKASGYRVSAKLLNAMYFHVPQSRQRMIFIGVRDDLGIEPSHPAAEGRPVTFRDAVIGLSETEQDELIGHVWVDEIQRKTKWVGRAITMKSGEKIVPSVPSGIRLFWDRPCPTIQKNAPPGRPPYIRNSQVHPTQPRTPSIREMARCQSFPDSFVFVDALHNGMHRIGNSAPPLFMEAIARHIRAEILARVAA